MEKDKRPALGGQLLILLAGCFWGSMGLFVRRLGALGFSSRQVACLRLTVGALVFVLLLLILDRKALKIRLRDLPLFLGLTVLYTAALRGASLLVRKGLSKIHTT